MKYRINLRKNTIWFIKKRLKSAVRTNNIIYHANVKDKSLKNIADNSDNYIIIILNKGTNFHNTRVVIRMRDYINGCYDTNKKKRIKYTFFKNEIQNYFSNCNQLTSCAIRYINCRYYDEAFRCLTYSAKLNEDLTLYYLGVYYYKTDKCFESLKYFEKAVSIGDPHAMLYLARHYRDLKILDKMVEYYNMAIDENMTDAIVDLIQYYKEIDDSENMIKYCHFAIEKECYDGAFNLGVYYEKKKDFDNMLKYYQIAAFSKNAPYIWVFQLAKYYFGLKNYDLVLKYLLAYKRVASNLLNLAFVYELIGNTEEMIKCYKEAVSNFNDSQCAYKLGSYYLQNQWEDAVHYLNFAAKYRHIDATKCLAINYEKKTDYANAIIYYDLAISYGSVEAYNLYGNLCYNITKNYNKAYELFSKGTKICDSKCKVNLNKFLNDRIDLDLMIDELPYLNKNNLNILNQLRETSDELIECCICLEDSVAPALYICKCRYKNVCGICFCQILRCPLCDILFG